jgi:hypothetical protein
MSVSEVLSMGGLLVLLAFGVFLAIKKGSGGG